MAAQKKIGARIVLDGEAEFRSAVNASKASLKELDSELKLSAAQFAKNTKSMDALKSAQTIYQKQQKQLMEQEKLYVSQLTKANTAYEKASKTHEETAKSIDELRKKLENAKSVYGESSREVEDLNKSLEDAEKQYEREEKALTGLESKMARYNTDLNETRTALVGVDGKLEEVNKNIQHYDDYVEDAADASEKAAPAVEKVGTSIGTLVNAQLIADGVRKLARAVVELAEGAVDVGSSFEKSMSNVEALANATGNDLDMLTNKAKEMGETTMFSATESADALSYMALAGWNTTQMLEGIEPVLHLAAAANMDLARASDIVTDYITAFGLSARDAEHFSDAMAYTMSHSNTTVELLGESYKNCAATAGSMGIAFEDVTAVLATMANAGVKGGEAGTALNTILTRLATNTKGCADKLAEYGVQIYDTEGNMNSLSSILDGMSKVWGTLSDQEQAALSKIVAGTNQYSKLQTIMLGVSDAAKAGGQSFEDYAEALRNCEGAAEGMADVMQDNLKGKITILQSALEGLGISVYEVFDDTLKDSVDDATKAVGRLNESVKHGDLNVSLARLGDSFGDLANKVVDFAEGALPGFIDAFAWIIDNTDMISAGIQTIVTGFVTYKAATFAAKLATMDFNAVLMLNPYAAAAAAITAIAMALWSFSQAAMDTAKSQTEATRETNNLIDETSAFNDTIRDSAAAREEDIQTIEAQASASRKLTSELYRENTTQERRAQIIAELKSIYPDLNVALDEHGQIIGATQQELEKYIDTSLELAKVEAAKGHLTEIAKQQFEAEQELAKIEDQLKVATDDLRASEEARAKDAEHHVDMNGNLVEVYNEYDAAVEESQKALEGLQEQQQATEETVKALGDEYQRTMEYIGDNSAYSGAAEGMSGIGGAADETAGRLQYLEDAYEEAKAAAYDSLNEQISLFDELSTKSDLSVGEISKNLKSQADTMNTYASDIDSAADLVKQGVLDEGILGAIIELGVDGAGYLHELVEAAEKDSDAFNEAMENWAEMKEAKANLVGAMAEFKTNYNHTKDELLKAHQKLNDETKVKHADAVKLWQQYGVDVSGEMQNQATQAEKDGAAIGEAVNAGVKSTASYENGYQLASDYGQGYIDGLNAKVEEARAAGANLAGSTAESTAEEQESASPSKVAIRLGSYFGEGYAIGLENSMSKATAIMADTIPSPKNVTTGPLSVLLSGGSTPGGNSTVINNTITVDGATDPETWTKGFVKTLQREARMAYG